MQVILLERIEKLGQMGEIVSVKPGYARNYLLPKGKALRATKQNEARFETQRAQLEAENLEQKGEAQTVAEKLEGQSFVVLRQAGEAGQLYGSVSSRDIAGAVTENGFGVGRNQVVLERPIKELGLHPVRISLHPEVSVTVTINVARTEEEAERQARGEDVTLDRFEEDEADEDFGEEMLEPEEAFEDDAAADADGSPETEVQSSE